MTSVKAGIGFPHARLAARITRTRVQVGTGKSSVQTVYAITNLTGDQVTPTKLDALVRGHWAIENRVHYVRDVTFDEDRSQVRTGNSPRVMAKLRNVAVGLIRARQRGQNIAAPPALSDAGPRCSWPSSITKQSHQSQEHQL